MTVDSVRSGPPFESDAAFIGRPMTLGGFLHEIATRDPDHEALVTGEERVTYEALRQEAIGIARSLVANGVGKASRVAILLPNGPDWVAAYFGVTLIGAVAVTINTFAPDDDIEYMLAVSDTQLLLTDTAIMERLAAGGLVDRHPLLVPGATAERDLTLPAFRATFLVDAGDLVGSGTCITEALVDALADQVVPGDDAMVMFTSGSTGRPKAVLHVHEAICIQSWRWAHLEDHTPAHRVWTTAPFFWSSGLVRSLGGPLAGGATIVLQRHFEPGAALDLLERERVTTILSRPHLDHRILEHPGFAERDLSSVIRVADGSPLRQRLLDAGPSRRGAYGMTETMTIVSYGHVANPDEEPGHGDVLAGVTVRIADPETGETTPIGVPGRIWIRSRTLMRGYYKSDRHEVFDADGFYGTSDIGFIDRANRLHWSGRLDNVIKVAGVNVSPTHVERKLEGWEALTAHAVFAVPHPDLGAALILCAAPGDRNEAEHPPVDAAAIREYLSGRLASYEMPRHIVLVDRDEVPFTSTLKVNVGALKTLAFGRLLDELDDEWLAHIEGLQGAGEPSGSA